MPPIAFWKGMNRQHFAITAATSSGSHGIAPSIEVASNTAWRFAGSPSIQFNNSRISPLV
ncbi:hypothetical protein D3C80_2120010 [compost metagenome]